jgi:hypothetical protein
VALHFFGFSQLLSSTSYCQEHQALLQLPSRTSPFEEHRLEPARGIFETVFFVIATGESLLTSLLDSSKPLRFPNPEDRYIMEAVMHQSRKMCPFLNRTAPATLRTLSTARNASPGGGTISNLQVLAKRCPIMGKALAVQSAKNGNTLNAACGTRRGYASGKARLHTSSPKEARAIDVGLFGRQEQGTSWNLKDLL